MLMRGYRHVAIVIAFIVLAVVLGGGGSPSPRTELLLELFAGLAALVWLWIADEVRLPADRLLWILALLIALVPALQLVPLPSALWQALPGRETQIAALELVGSAESWRPLSVSPGRTLASLLSLVPPLLLMLMTGALSRRERQWLILAVAGMAIVSALLGAAQVSSAGRGALRLYGDAPWHVVTGFQANRNSTADLLLIGLLAVAAAAAGHYAGNASRRSRTASWGMIWMAGAAVLLACACVLTGSRTGIALLLPVSIACVLILNVYGPKAWKRRSLITVAGILLTFLGGAVLLNYNPALQRVAARFGLGDKTRPELWSDTLYAIGQYWPTGSGMGTFVPTFLALEPLDAVDPSIPNRAHNDYLELMLEAGAPGIAILLACVAILLFMAWRSWRGTAGERWQTLFSVGVLAVIAAHSAIDYPLRSMAIACLAAVAVGLLARPPEQNKPA